MWVSENYREDAKITETWPFECGEQRKRLEKPIEVFTH
jgi:hypothetical protein